MSDQNNKNNKDFFQFIWGLLLFSMGAGMFFSIPDKMQQITQKSTSVTIFAYLSLYLIGVILLVGGARKIYTYFTKSDDKD